MQRGAIRVFNPVAFESSYRTLSLGQALSGLGMWKEMANGSKKLKMLGTVKD
jgi:hypothetical protein